MIVERWSLCLFEGHKSDYFYGMITFSPMIMMVMIPAILEPTTARVVNSPTLVLQATTKKKVQD